MNQKQASLPWSLGITAVWTCVVLFLVSRHELWLDEAQHWLVARDSNSLNELFFNMRYEGHPPLWNLLLYVITRFTSKPEAMQYVHVAFAAGTVFLIMRYAAFPLWLRCLLPFTFFLGYEYAVISRNYAPAVFFIVMACVFITNQDRKPVLIALMLGIATCFHVYAGAVAGVLLIYVLRQKTGWPVILKSLGVFALFGFAALVFLVRTPSDHFLYESHMKIFSLQKTGTALLLPFTSLMHIPDLAGDHWWNTNLFLGESDIVKAISGLVFWALPVYFFRSNRSVMWLYVAGTLIISLVIWMTPMQISVRHAGFVAVLFLVCLWMAGSKIFEVKSTRWIGLLLLVVQCTSFGVTAYKEWTREFSRSESVAAFIRANYPATPIAVFPVYMGPSVAAYLEKPVFYSYDEQEGSFADWSFDDVLLQPEEMITDCHYYMEQEAIDSMILVAPVSGEYFDVKLPDSTLRATFTGAAVRAENFNVYLLKRK